MRIHGPVARRCAATLFLLLAVALPSLAAAAPLLFEPVEAKQAADADASRPARSPVRVDETALAGLQVGSHAAIRLPGETTPRAIEIFARHQNLSGTVTVFAHLPGSAAGSRLVLTSGAGGRFATIDNDSRHYHLVGDAGNDIIVADAGVAQSGGEDAELAPETMLRAPAPLTADSAPASAATPTVDLMIMYTQTVAARYGTGIQARLDHLVAVANQAYSDSGANVTLRLVHIEPVTYSDTIDPLTALHALAAAENPTLYTGDPGLANALTLRNKYGADLVSLVRAWHSSHFPSAYGFFAVYNDANFTQVRTAPNLGYTVVSEGPDADGTDEYAYESTLAHETGHNMGLDHDIDHISCTGCRAYNFSRGYGIAGQFATIMSHGYIVAPVYYVFSNPSLPGCAGSQCGISETNVATGTNNVLTLNQTASLAAAFRATAGAAPGITPATGYWWNPAEPGRGFNIEQRNGNLFMASFLYDASGRPTWYGVGPGAITNGSYTGTLTAYSNGQTLTGNFQPATVVGPAGNFSVTFTSATQGSITWAGGTTPIQRYDFVTGGSSSTNPTGTPETGWWWAPSEGGRGYAIEIQKGQMFLAGYMYDASGNPIWYASGPTAMSGTTLYSGEWAQFGNGQTLGGAFKASSITNPAVGTVSIQFTSTTSGILTFPNGRQVVVQRYQF
jgi:Metallo-peptidase family M12B Reprolysin-like